MARIRAPSIFRALHDERLSSALPMRPHRLPRRNWGRLVARVFCVLFAIIGLAPVAVVLLIRSDFAHDWVEERTEELVAREGLDASYDLDIDLWPVAVRLESIDVRKAGATEPAIQAGAITLKPKFFALLAGELAVDEIEVDAPDVRLVIKGKRIENLGIDIPESDDSSEGIDLPFEILAVTDGHFDVDIDDAHIEADAVDLDITSAEQHKSAFAIEVGVRAAEAHVHLKHPDPSAKDARGKPAVRVDEDVVCALDGRARIEEARVRVHHLNAEGFVDLDPKPGTKLSCASTAADRRRVEVGLSHLEVKLPSDPDKLPQIAGHIEARAPLRLASRYVPMPDVDGWVRVDIDGEYDERATFPALKGRVEASELRVEQYNFAHLIRSELQTDHGIVRSADTFVTIGEGNVHLKDVEVRPLEKGIPIKTRVEVDEVEFASLMRDLGVSESPHVVWDVRQLRLSEFGGTLDPLKLDGDMVGHTEDFAVFDRAAKAHDRVSIIDFERADLRAHVSVRPEALQFSRVHAILDRSDVRGGFVSIGFHEDLRVDVPQADIDLADIATVGSIPISGMAHAKVNVGGIFSDPVLKAEAQIDDFSLGAIPFGSVAHAEVGFQGDVVHLGNVQTQKGESVYEVPSARLDFGGEASVMVDAIASSDSFDVRDFFSIFHLEDDPRFQEIKGHFSTRSSVRVALGGPLDRCGGGYVDVDAHAHFRDLELYGERFDDGDVDLSYEWQDREAGIRGADVDIRSVTLHKLRTDKAGIAIGTLFGSGQIHRGSIGGSVVVQGVPLGRIQALGTASHEVDGTVSGFAQVGGSLDAYDVRGDIEVSPVLVRGQRFGSSRVRVSLEERSTPSKIVGTSGCGAPIEAEFDPIAYANDTSEHGNIRASGELFNRQISLTDVTMTRGKLPRIVGKVGFHSADLGALSRVFASEDPATSGASPSQALKGRFSGELDIASFPIAQPDRAKAELRVDELAVDRGSQSIGLATKGSRITLAGDVLGIPAMVFDLNAGAGLRGKLTVSGAVRQVTTNQALAIDADLAPIDLSVLVGVVPKLERAAGQVSAKIHIGGTAKLPKLNGSAQVRGGQFDIQGLPSRLADVDIDLRADKDEIRVERGVAMFAGGNIQVRGSVPIRGLSVGQSHLEVRVRGVHIEPTDGVAARADADLLLSVGGIGGEGRRRALPHLSGDVKIVSLEYSRAVKLTTDLSALGVGARRTQIETYDPDLDFLTIDLRLLAERPFVIHNNFVDAQLGIHSGSLHVTGTNQRIGLRGELRALPGGRFQFRSTDFEVKQAIIRFDDPTRVDPKVDVLATTEYRRHGGNRVTADVGSGRSTGYWRITLHAYGDPDDLKLDLTSDPPLSERDIVLLLTIGMTYAEVDQMRAGTFGAGAAFEALATVSGADRAVKDAVPIIDDFRFGSGYSIRSGRTEPQITVGKRITDDIRANVTTNLSENRELRSNIEWRLSRRTAVQGSYDNVNDVSSSNVGNVGVDFRWRLEFE